MVSLLGCLIGISDTAVSKNQAPDRIIPKLLPLQPSSAQAKDCAVILVCLFSHPASKPPACLVACFKAPPGSKSIPGQAPLSLARCWQQPPPRTPCSHPLFPLIASSQPATGSLPKSELRPLLCSNSSRGSPPHQVKAHILLWPTGPFHTLDSPPAPLPTPLQGPHGPLLLLEPWCSPSLHSRLLSAQRLSPRSPHGQTSLHILFRRRLLWEAFPAPLIKHPCASDTSPPLSLTFLFSRLYFSLTHYMLYLFMLYPTPSPTRI